LRAVLGIVKAVEVTSGGRIRRVKLSVTELSSLSSKLDGILYQGSSLSLVRSLATDSLELGGEESSDWPFDKSGKSNRPPKVAIIKNKSAGKKLKCRSAI
jgi:hypothetical protein